MKHLSFSTSIKITLLAIALTGCVAIRADDRPSWRHAERHDADNRVVVPVFRESSEARLLRDAYLILATGNHNYNGHRDGAMQQVRAAALKLGLDLRGDGNNLQPQPLSNERLREAKGLILRVRESAWVNRQGPIFNHLSEAVHQINEALGIK